MCFKLRLFSESSLTYQKLFPRILIGLMLENYLAKPSEIGLCSAIPLKAFSVLKFIVTQGSGVPWCSLFPTCLGEVSFLCRQSLYSEKPCFYYLNLSQTYTTKQRLDKVSGHSSWNVGLWFWPRKQLLQKRL